MPPREIIWRYNQGIYGDKQHGYELAGGLRDEGRRRTKERRTEKERKRELSGEVGCSSLQEAERVGGSMKVKRKEGAGIRGRRRHLLLLHMDVYPACGFLGGAQ